MKLLRDLQPQRASALRLAWYEGVAYYELEKDCYVVAIIPLNLLLRVLRGLYYWVKVGVWVNGRDKCKFTDNRKL